MADTSFPPNLLPDEASPEWMNKGDNAWQLTAATLVGLQTVPGLIILYGGAVKKKWAVNSAFMAFYAFACVLICWVGWGYRMSFGTKLVPFWGRANVALDQVYLLDPAFIGKFPQATMVFFNSFCSDHCGFDCGSLVGADEFLRVDLFVPLWLTFSYTFVAFSIWCPSGFLAKAGIIDYSGGYVIHLSSGVAGFTAAYWVGPRLTKDRERFPPNNILLMMAGAGLLWMGWTGFNGGDPYVVSVDASLAVLNTHVCTATSLLTWLILDIAVFGKASIIGAVQGMITGLVCITPAAGVVQGWAAIIMGIFSGSIPWFTMMVVHKKSELLQKVDDTMAVLHTHAIAGSLGGILTGLFASPKLNRLFYGYGVDVDSTYVGLFYGLHMGEPNMSCGATHRALRMSDEDMEIGDEAAHGEEAYAIWGQGDKLENSRYGSSVYGDVELPMPKPRELAKLR
ncbi:Ammonium transporter 3 member 1 [Vitis vinifera]|uniref:Ammonium transporter 3 member 1 n=1 Tax=Vitis vinifera TaxID=29760 RepID=A0A438F2A4_VITVI|nr:Ammonium transporter 3 member 1 [Vitis vinifera]